MVRRKNVVSMIALSFVALVLVSVQWVLVGNSLAFSSDIAGFVGGSGFLGLNGVGMDCHGTIPHLAFMVFQLAFAAITLAILTSAMAERVKVSGFIVFGLLWTTLVYDPLAHWAWGAGWLAELGALDFAGGTLALTVVIGKRLGFGEHQMRPHSIPMTLFGASLLWFGWFGFNGGSALAANGLAANAFVVTNTSAAARAIGWMFASWNHGKQSSLGMVSGAVAGLVAITPAAGFVGPMSALVIGGVAGVLCYRAMLFRIKRGFDESLDAWAIHGVGGLWGALATGIFAIEVVGGYMGLLYGNVDQFTAQIIGAGAAILYAFTITLILAKIVDVTIGLRVTEEEEYVGLDISQHGEEAYA